MLKIKINIGIWKIKYFECKYGGFYNFGDKEEEKCVVILNFFLGIRYKEMEIYLEIVE